MRLYLARHGRTEWAEDGRYCGTSDPPLTEEGEEQARRLARRLAGASIGRILTSPRIRAARTAAILGDALGLPVEVIPHLGETDFGAWEGLTRPEIMSQFPEEWRAWQARPDAVSPPGGESGLQTWQRTRPAVRQAWTTRPDRLPLIVAHRMVNRILLSRLLGLPLRWARRLEQGEACLNILEMAAPLRASTLVCLNDTCHLQPPR
jgi:broad specificity phosphatase PhoE